MKGISKLVLLAVLVFVVTVFMAAPVMAASKGKLVKEHKYKISYYEKGKWTTKGYKYYVNKYKYSKKGDLAAVTNKSRKNGKKEKTQWIERYKLTYKKGKLYKSDFNEESYSSTTYYKKNVPIREEYSDDDGSGIAEFTYKSRYLSRRDTTFNYSDEEYGDPDTPSITTVEYDVQTKDGYPVKISRTDADYEYRTVVTFYTKGAKKGLIKKAVEKSDDGYRHEFKYSYKIKKGQVKSYTIKDTETVSSGKVYKIKQTGTFKYTKKKAGDKRYRSMINTILSPNPNFFVTYW